MEVTKINRYVNFRGLLILKGLLRSVNIAGLFTLNV